MLNRKTKLFEQSTRRRGFTKAMHADDAAI
jgi:hypothetical protein